MQNCLIFQDMDLFTDIVYYIKYRINQMIRLLTFALFSALIFFGCNQESETTSPADNSPNSQLKLISLPVPSGGLGVEILVTQYKEIDGDEGGRFEAEFSYQGGPFGEVTVKSKLDFKEDAFEGIKNISQTLDTDLAVMSFGPSMQFNERVKVDLRIEGLDLSNVDPTTLDFVYIDNNGSTHFVEYDELTMDVSNGRVDLDNAILPHFSRYGFVH